MTDTRKQQVKLIVVSTSLTTEQKIAQIDALYKVDGLREKLDFVLRVAKAFDASRDSHVFFYLQQAYPENEDWEWKDFQDLLNRVLQQDTKDTCPECGGSGNSPNTNIGDYDTGNVCWKCSGTGKGE